MKNKPPIKQPFSPEKREQVFWQNVDKTGDCWVWTRSLTPKGYGIFFDPPRKITLAYHFLVGKAASELQWDHLCRNRACVRPSHLELVTAKVNSFRGFGLGALNALKTHCPKGHEYSATNTYRPPQSKGRICRICQREKNRLKKQRQRLHRLAVSS